MQNLLPVEEAWQASPGLEPFAILKKHFGLFQFSALWDEMFKLKDTLYLVNQNLLI